jgi:DNA polymerase-3 subunit delta'
MFRDIKGQDKAIRLLNNAIRHDRISQAYLFHGPEGVGKFTAALYFGMALNCVARSDKRPCGSCVSCIKYLDLSHPDFSYIFPTPNIKTKEDGEMKNQSITEYLSYLDKRKTAPWEKMYFTGSTLIRKESMETLQKKFEFTQREGKYRICIIEEADEMNPSTANSFLKTLEEPPENTIIILLTTKVQSLLPTIVSRCQQVFFQPLSYKIIEEILISRFLIDKQIAKTYSRIANGNLGQAIRLTKDTKHESRNLMIALVKAAMHKDDLYITGMFSSVKDKYKAEFIHDMLYHLALWLNDITAVLDERKDITNTDYWELLQESSKLVTNWDESFLDILRYIDELHLKLDGNVNVQLILINLFHKLRKLFLSNG